MLFDVVDSLKMVATVGDIRVLTPDAEVETALRTRYTDVATMRDPNCGDLNTALSHAIQVLEQQGISRVLIIPADLPMVQSQDLEHVLETPPDRSMGIAHDKTGEGTNLLLLNPPSIVDLHFGARSFAAHVEEARRRKIRYRVFDMPSLLWDLDCPEDMQTFLSRESNTGTYRELLRLRVDRRILSLPLGCR